MSGLVDLTVDSGNSDNDDDVGDGDLQAALEASLATHIHDRRGKEQAAGASCSKSAVESKGGSSSTASSRDLQNKRALDVQQARPASQPRVDGSMEARRKRPRNVDSPGKLAKVSAPPLFRLISTPTDGPQSGTVSLSDLLSGEFTEALMTNYMVDMMLLLQAQPRIACVPITLVHGFKPNT